MKLGIIKKRYVYRDIFLVLGIITGFIFIVTFSSLYVSDAIKNNNACGCVIPIPIMILILSSLGLFVGSFSYYFIIAKLTREQRQTAQETNYTLNFLESDERVVVRELIKNNFCLKQAEIERRTGINKVKVHRVLKRLIAKGVVEKKPEGKINKILLHKELQKLFA